MQLETLITSLGITEHMKALSDWRDDLLREKAAELQALTVDLGTNKDEALSALGAEHQAAIDALRAEVSELQSQIATLLAPPNPATLAFRALPIEIQEQFQSSYDTAALLIDAGRSDLAIAHIEGLKIPKNLEPYRTGILDLLKS